MPIVRIEIWSGQKQEIKKNLAKAITDVMVENIGCPTEEVTTIFDEIPKQNWVIEGQFCSDVFKDVP
jgi:4-oxalocrotonate tautomerase